MPVPHLPLEIYALIVSYLEGNHDLLTLCATSRAWCLASHRALFRHVKIRGRTSLNTWTKAILSSPRMAASINAITLPTSATLTPHEKFKFADALSRVVNLQELYISHTMTLDTLGNYIEPWMLEGCSGELRVFHNELEGFQAGFKAYSPFLRDHSQISSIYWARKDESSSVDHKILHNLTTVHLAGWWALDALAPRRISRIRVGRVALTRDTMTSFAMCLSQFKATLTHLSVWIYDVGFLSRNDDALSMVDVIRLLGRRVPKITFLDLHGDVDLSFSSEIQNDELVEALSSFEKLDTIMLDSSKQARYSMDVVPVESFVERRHFATRLMESCRQLHRVALGSQSGYNSRVGSPCYVRCPDGDVELKGFGVINSGSWAVI